jgi:pyruvate,water dikinase
VTVSCAEGDKGHVYAGKLEFKTKDLNREDIPETKTLIMLNIGTPEAAIRGVREKMGFANVTIMILFCRTPAEADTVMDVLDKNGLRRGEKDLEVYIMAEIPTNILEAAAFAERFDGFSIGSNDLTQLTTLGIGRDSEKLAPLFDESEASVKIVIRMLIDTAHKAGRTVGICGEAPSNDIEFAAFLVEACIDSISLQPDSVLRVVRRVAEMEQN